MNKQKTISKKFNMKLLREIMHVKKTLQPSLTSINRKITINN